MTQRTKSNGFIGVNLGKAGDLSLLKRLDKEVEKTTMSRSVIVRLALMEYFEKRDK